MIKSAYPDRSPGDHFRKHPLRGLKFLTWIPSGSMRLALDPQISNREFNRLWRQRRHGIVIGWILPVLVVLGRLLQIEKLVEWHIARYQKRHPGRSILSRRGPDAPNHSPRGSIPDRSRSTSQGVRPATSQSGEPVRRRAA